MKMSNAWSIRQIHVFVSDKHFSMHSKIPYLRHVVCDCEHLHNCKFKKNRTESEQLSGSIWYGRNWDSTDHEQQLTATVAVAEATEAKFLIVRAFIKKIIYSKMLNRQALTRDYEMNKYMRAVDGLLFLFRSLCLLLFHQPFEINMTFFLFWFFDCQIVGALFRYGILSVAGVRAIIFIILIYIETVVVAIAIFHSISGICVCIFW